MFVSISILSKALGVKNPSNLTGSIIARMSSNRIGRSAGNLRRFSEDLRGGGGVLQPGNAHARPVDRMRLKTRGIFFLSPRCSLARLWLRTRSRRHRPQAVRGGGDNATYILIITTCSNNIYNTYCTEFNKHGLFTSLCLTVGWRGGIVVAVCV